MDAPDEVLQHVICVGVGLFPGTKKVSGIIVILKPRRIDRFEQSAATSRASRHVARAITATERGQDLQRNDVKEVVDKQRDAGLLGFANAGPNEFDVA